MHSIHSTLAAHSARLFFRKLSGSAQDIIVDLVNKHLTTCEVHMKSSPLALNTQLSEKKGVERLHRSEERGQLRLGTSARPNTEPVWLEEQDQLNFCLQNFNGK